VTTITVEFVTAHCDTDYFCEICACLHCRPTGPTVISTNELVGIKPRNDKGNRGYQTAPGPVSPPCGSITVFVGVSNPAALCWVTVNIRLFLAVYSWPLCSNITSPIKPEVHNVSQRRQMRIEPWPQVTHMKNLVKTGRVAPEICSRTETHRDEHTGRHTRHDTPFCQRGVMGLSNKYYGSGLMLQSLLYIPVQTENIVRILSRNLTCLGSRCVGLCVTNRWLHSYVRPSCSQLEF